MAIINYEGALLLNLTYSLFTQKEKIAPALDMQTYLAAFNAVSEKDNERGRPTAPPFFEAPIHPLLQLLRDAVSEMVDKDSGEIIHKQDDGEKNGYR